MKQNSVSRVVRKYWLQIPNHLFTSSGDPTAGKRASVDIRPVTVYDQPGSIVVESVDLLKVVPCEISMVACSCSGGLPAVIYLPSVTPAV
jgi:hypothetical protein